MTSSDNARTPVDLDLLADFVDGLLPAAQAAAVERQIARDSRWASAADEIRSAQSAVVDRLRSAGATTEPMPDAVFQRILGNLPDRAGASAASADHARAPARVISLADRRRSRRVLWPNVAKIAAAVIAVAGIGIGVGVINQSHGENTRTSAGKAATNNAPGFATPSTAGLVVQASGHDYGPDLGAGPVGTTRVEGGGAPIPDSRHTSSGREPVGPNATVAGPVPASLDRLARGGLSACVAAVSGQLGAAPIAADFAYYRGQPAVVFQLGGSARQVAVGADCGLAGKGADVLATAG